MEADQILDVVKEYQRILLEQEGKAKSNFEKYNSRYMEGKWTGLKLASDILSSFLDKANDSKHGKTFCQYCKELVIPVEHIVKETEEYQGSEWETGETSVCYSCPVCGCQVSKPDAPDIVKNLKKIPF
jgi:uncharacterized protein with PIN domain